MLNSLKKWVQKDDNAQGKIPPQGLHSMRSDLQKKFSKGVQYNLKIIIRGDRNTGKTCLWHRLQGHKFVEEYVPTPEIQATSIQWNYKATDDIVKVDVWDVVDQGKRKKNDDNLKLSHADDEEDDHKLDASFLDVYKGAHAVIMVFDITKKWTFRYIEKELPGVPAHIPVLILANYRDMGSHRVIDLDEVQGLSQNIDRPPGSAGVLFLESSMKNGFGLKYIHKFFNLPFLILQRESLLKQLETNHLDVESCLEELYYEPNSEEQNFDVFMQMVHEKNNPKKVNKSPSENPQPAHNGHAQNQTSSPRGQQESNIPAPVSNEKQQSPPTTLDLKTPSNQEPLKSDSGLFSPSMMTEASTPVDQPQKEPEKKGFMSRFFRGSSTKPAPAKPSEPTAITPSTINPAVSMPPVKDIDEFIPDDGDTNNFLNEIPNLNSGKRVAADPDYSSSEDEGHNPMVAGFQEELDSDDQIPAETHKVYTYSDSDEDYIMSHKVRNSKNSTHKVSSRSVPKSRISPEPRKEDSKLQHLVIESDSSVEVERPDIMADKDSLSEDDYLHSQGTIKKEAVKDKTAKKNEHPSPIIKHEKHHNVSNEPTPKSNETKPRSNKVMNYEDDSSDGEDSNQMVSTFVDDVSSGDDNSKAKDAAEENDEGEEQVKDAGLSLQFQSSDFDFLEKISSKPETTLEKTCRTPKTETQSRKTKTGHKKKKEGTEESTKKHKHKKKKNKSKDGEDANTSIAKSGKKKKSRTKATEDKDLEEFLGGGEGYDSF